MPYTEFGASPAQSSMVRCFWTLTERTGARTPEPVYPDGSPELILSLGDPMRAMDPRGVMHEQPRLMLVGQITRPLIVEPTGHATLIGVRLQPYGAYPLHARMQTITNHWVDVASRLRLDLGDDDLRAQLLDDPAVVLEPVLAALFAAARRPHVTVTRAVDTIMASQGMIELDMLAQQLDVSPRTLQRLFAAQVGMSPKLLARIRRFQRVFHAWRDDPRQLARVAVDCGYFDQSHLVRDFRAFAGEAPTAALTAHSAFTAYFLP